MLEQRSTGPTMPVGIVDFEHIYHGNVWIGDVVKTDFWLLKEKKTKETEELKQKLRDAEEELQKSACQPVPAPTMEIFIDKLKEEVPAAKQTNQRQEKDLKDLLVEKQHYYPEADEYSKQIVE